MRVAVVFNPKSGRGRAGEVFAAVRAALIADGHSVIGVSPCAPDALARATAGCDVLVAVGGDGTCNLSAAACARNGAALLTYPAGTENLLARELRSSADANEIARQLREDVPMPIDLGEAAGATFAVMCGIGPDAGVTQRLTQRRRGAISHLSYLRPIFEEALAPNLPALRVSVDGRVLVDGERGMLIIANCRRYALGINPAPEARMDDGLLDVVFMPAASTLAALAWLLQAKAGTHTDRASIREARGVSVVIRSDRDAAFQLDGDPASVSCPAISLLRAGATLCVNVRPAAVRVYRRNV